MNSGGFADKKCISNQYRKAGNFKQEPESSNQTGLKFSGSGGGESEISIQTEPTKLQTARGEKKQSRPRQGRIKTRPRKQGSFSMKSRYFLLRRLRLFLAGAAAFFFCAGGATAPQTALAKKSGVLVAQNEEGDEEDFDDSVLKDIEDIEEDEEGEAEEDEEEGDDWDEDEDDWDEEEEEEEEGGGEDDWDEDDEDWDEEEEEEEGETEEEEGEDDWDEDDEDWDEEEEEEEETPEELEEPEGPEEGGEPSFPEEEEPDDLLSEEPEEKEFPDLEEEEEPDLETESLPDDPEGLNVISNIRYKADSDRILIDSSQVISYQIRHNRKNRQVIIEILESRLEDSLKWPYILKDFATGFAMLQADQKDGRTVRVIIQIKEGRPFPVVILEEKGDQIAVAFQDSLREAGPAAKIAGADEDDAIKTAADFYFGKAEFSGRPLSFHVINAPIQQVLRFISEESGLNMVIGDGVRGQVTLKLENVPWDQAFHTILQVKGLGYIRQKNVAVIDTLQNLQNLTENLEKLNEKNKTAAAFKTKVIPVAYAKITEIVNKLSPLLTKGATPNSAQGRLIINEESGTILAHDTAETIKRIEKLAQFLDKPPRQVMIEARIVDVVETFSERFGLAWDINNTLPVRLDIFTQFEHWLGSAFSFDVNEQGSNADLSVSNFPLIGNLNATLSLAESKGYAKVISSPKVVTLSGKTASIDRNAPILVAKGVTTGRSAAGETATQETFEQQDIKINLTVTPNVTSAGSVFLKISINRASPGPAQKKGDTTHITRTATTDVLVKNGHTVVIGGIYQYDETSGREGLPFFRSIPFLKHLFGAFQFQNSKSELLVFLTPKIVDEIQ